MKTQKADVNLGPNWAVVLKFLESRGIDVDQFIGRRLSPEVAEKCRQLTNTLRAKRTLAKPYPNCWVPLSEWLEVEQGLVTMLGHYHHLREVGRFSQQVAFGMDAIGNALVTSPRTRWATSPKLGYSNVPRISAKYIKNKELEFVNTRDGEGYIVLKHRRDIASPLDDIGAIGWYIPGYGDAVRPMWGQPPDPPSPVTVIAVNPEELVGRVEPTATTSFEGTSFRINGVEHGRVVYVKSDKKDYVLNGSAYYTEQFAGAVPVVLITRDFNTPCFECRQRGGPTGHPILAKGQVFSFHGYELQNSAFKVFWETKKKSNGSSLLDRILGPLLVLMTGLMHLVFGKRAEREFARTVDIDSALSETERELAQSEQFITEMREYLAGAIPPTEEVFRQVVSRTFVSKRHPMAVLFWDTVAFTVKTDEWEPERVSALVNDLLTKVTEITVKNGGVVPKNLGDGAMAYFTCGYPGDKRHIGARELVLNALRTAIAIHGAAKELGLELRVGINFGEAILGLVGKTLDVIGRPVNIAARCEPLAQTGGTILSGEAMRLLDQEAGKVKVGGTIVVGADTFRFEGIKRIKHGGTLGVFSLYSAESDARQAEPVVKSAPHGSWVRHRTTEVEAVVTVATPGQSRKGE